VRVTVERMQRVVSDQALALTEWLDEGQRIAPVAGETQRHFDALAELCQALPHDADSSVLLTSAFLSERNLQEPDGLVDALGAAPPRTRFLLAWGHASDNLPERLTAEARRWKQVLGQVDADVADRLELTITKRRSHEKVVVTSAGGWLVGSWNPASSRPNATVFEASLRGTDTGFAKQLLDRIAENMESAPAGRFVGLLGAQLGPPRQVKEGRAQVEALGRALSLLVQAIPNADGTRAEAWGTCLQATRHALMPFLATAKVQLVDEQQTLYKHSEAQKESHAAGSRKGSSCRIHCSG